MESFFVYGDYIFKELNSKYKSYDNPELKSFFRQPLKAVQGLKLIYLQLEIRTLAMSNNYYVYHL